MSSALPSLWIVLLVVCGLSFTIPAHGLAEQTPVSAESLLPGYIKVDMKVDRLPLPALPGPQADRILAADFFNCWGGKEEPNQQLSNQRLQMFSFCCGVRFAAVGVTHDFCWGGPPGQVIDRVIHPKCCVFGAVCNAYDIYNHRPADALLWSGMGSIPPLATRDEIPCVLEAEGKRRGVELGVYKGEFARTMLYNWPSAEEYILVDLWSKQSDYQDVANDSLTEDAESVMVEALRRLQPWEEKVRVCRDFTTACAELFPDEYFDFVYIDARHDRHSVALDLEDWWPKLNVGGIMAGHDYVTQWEVWGKSVDEGKQFWAVSPDGKIEEDGLLVKGAVDEFALRHRRSVHTTQQDLGFGTFWSWMLRK
eukprot:GHVS01086528.1.p1 GENE.GHVS01086528.1~~GHVS01086528.1.p1  ORF type:complete len:366 (+),score=42.85 GHVS01086528.1:184-1281(+)